MPCAASPPSAFCQEKVTTSSFGHSSGCANAAEVASQMVRPVRSAAIQSAFGTRTPDVVPFQVKTTSLAGSTFARSGSSPYAGLECGDVLELELLDDVVDPTLAERFPGNERHWARAKQRPERHFDRAGIGGGHDADSIIGREPQGLRA